MKKNIYKCLSQSKLNKNVDYKNLSSQEAKAIEGGDLATGSMQSTGFSERTWSPSVQTLLDRPPANFPHRLMLGGILFCAIFGAWAWFGEIQEVGKARGKLIPKGSTFKIESTNVGKVDRLLVEEGDRVRTGQVLIELDSELQDKEVKRLEQALANHQEELAHKLQLLEKVTQEAEATNAIAANEILAQKTAVALGEQQIETATKTIAQMKQEELIHRARIDRIAPLQTSGAISKEFLFQAEQELRNLLLRMTQTEGELNRAAKDTERLRLELTQKLSEARRIQLQSQQKIQQLQLEIDLKKAKIEETQNVLVAAQIEFKNKFFKSPVDGVILSLNLQNSGQVVQPGKTIAEIAPTGAELVLSGILPNQEAGFVEAGMPVEIKFDAYPYQDFGTIPGQVLSISSDAETDENLGEVYRIEISLEQYYVNKGKQKISFKAGQTATADIVIRNRRIAEVLLEPLRGLQRDGLEL